MHKRWITGVLALTLIAGFGCKDNKKPDATPTTNSATNNTDNETTSGDTAGDTSQTNAAAEPAQDAAEDTWLAKFETTVGDFTVEIHPAWAPKGAARFRELVESGYYTDIAAFRVIDGFMAQFGIHGDPEMNKKWRENRIDDDPRNPDVSNTRGRMTFAMAGPNTRTTQLFINYRDNKMLDSQGFTPIGEVVGDGMKVVDSFHKGYGEGAPRGKGPSQGRMQQEGNEYLKKDFPELTYINNVTIVSDDAAGAAADTDNTGKPADAQAKKAFEAGSYSDGAVKSRELDEGSITLVVKDDGSVSGKLQGKREGKGFSIALKGAINDAGSLTAEGSKGSAEVKVRGKADGGLIKGAVLGKINAKGARATFEAKK